MAVTLQWSSFAFLLAGVYGASAACPSFNISYPSMRTLLCPGDTITYTCTFATSNTGFITTQWSGSAFQCPSNSPSPNVITLSQASTGPPNPTVTPCGNLSAVMTNVSGTCYTSVLTIPTPQYYNGTTVACVDTSFNVVGNVTLNVLLASPPNAPNITSLTSTYSDQLTVTWASVPTATNYSVSINSTHVTITSSGPLQNTFTGLTNNTVYTVSVVAINCAGNSSAATATNQTSNIPPTTPPPATSSASTQSSTSNTALGLGIGLGVGIPVLLALVLVTVGVVYFCCCKGDSRSKISNTEGSPDYSEAPSKPPRTAKQTSPPSEQTSKPAPPKEGLVYADVGVAKAKSQPASKKPDADSGVAYSSIKHE